MDELEEKNCRSVEVRLGTIEIDGQSLVSLRESLDGYAKVVRDNGYFNSWIESRYDSGSETRAFYVLAYRSETDKEQADRLAREKKSREDYQERQYLLYLKLKKEFDGA